MTVGEAVSVIMGRVDRSAGVLLRWCRAVVLAAVAMVAGVTGHLSADGLMPGASALGLIFGLCVLGAGMFLGRPASRLRVVVLLVGGQTFIHGALTALAGHRGDPPLVRPTRLSPLAHRLPVAAGSEHRVGSLMDQLNAGQPSGQQVQLAVPYPIQHLVADLTGAHAVMALAHLLAAVVVGLWLAAGERTLWVVLRLTAELAGRVLASTLARFSATAAGHLAATGARLRQPLVRSWVIPPTARGLSRSVVRRGPPAPVAA